MAIVHCRYGDDHSDDADPGDGYVWLCLGAFGADDAPGGCLDEYHHELPLRPCSCGFDPREIPEPQADGRWHPAHP